MFQILTLFSTLYDSIVNTVSVFSGLSLSRSTTRKRGGVGADITLEGRINLPFKGTENSMVSIGVAVEVYGLLCTPCGPTVMDLAISTSEVTEGRVNGEIKRHTSMLEGQVIHVRSRDS